LPIREDVPLESGEYFMAQFEQIYVAPDHANPQGGVTLQTHSPGVGTTVSQEILTRCRNWALSHPRPCDHPVLLSFPLKAVMPAIKGPLYAVVQVAPTYPAAFHALILAKADYRALGYNPFMIAACGIFLDSLPGGQRLSRGTLQPPPARNLFSPPANPGDVGLVDEALQRFLLKGSLILNLDQPSQQSDRVLGLVMHFMPRNLRERLCFASFAGPGDPQYGLAAAFATGNDLSSWQRLFMTMDNQGIPESIRRYVAQVRNALVTGDPGVVNTDEVLPVAGKSTPTPPCSQPLAAVPMVNGSTGAGTGAPFAAGPGQPATGTSSTSSPKPTIGLARPVPAGGGRIGTGRTGSGGDESGSHRRGRSRLVRQALPTRIGSAGRQSHLLGAFSMLVILLVATWVYLDRSGKGREWGIFDLMGPGSVASRSKPTPSLLEVVDVGEGYTRQISRIQRGRLLPGQENERQLRRAQAELLAGTAGPLLNQVEMFLELAEDGIQQGHRPDREQARLGALADQGSVLVAELGRLELAYFSFGHAVLWADLPKLNDAQVAARKDSLIRSEPAAMTEVAMELGSASYWGSLISAHRNVEGMAGLLRLFAAPEWTSAWEADLKTAAEKVSPTASSMSRAYRNNAFTLLRLKRAERSESGQLAAYVSDIQDRGWLSPGVRDVLTDLRRKSTLFGRDKLPPLLQGILSLYAQLEEPHNLAAMVADSPEAWRDLQANPGWRFDPKVYAGHLDRIRFEAAALLAASGTAVAELPGYLASGWDGPVLELFLAVQNDNENSVDWPTLAAAARQTYLGRWAEQRSLRVASRLDELRTSVDRAWERGFVLQEQLATRVAAGQDWTSVWVDLQDQVQIILGNAPSVFANDPERSAKRNHMLALQESLTEARPLHLQSVVIRLEQQALAQPGGVVLEFQRLGSSQTHRSAPVRMGPAAPAGTGWVGTGHLEIILPASPEDAFEARVLVPGRDEPVLVVHYPPLSERVGPGAFTRPRRGEGGSLTIRTDDSWWRSLRLSGPGQPGL
jgi:hypothetical protein